MRTKSTQYDKIRRATIWSLGIGLAVAWLGPFIALAEPGGTAPLAIVAGCAGLVVFSWLFVRVVNRVVVGLPARREIVAAGAVAVLTLLLTSWRVPQQAAVIGWPLILAVWAGVAALVQTRLQAVVTGVVTVLVLASVTGAWDGRVYYYAFVTVTLTWANRFQIWFWQVVRAAHEGKEAQAKLAVTEERLRFSRDLHDTVGHSLSAIAVKSELAARLAEVDAAGAAEEMAEVRRLARESLREIRAVVHGYRTVDLQAELRSVTAVLEAAGIVCTLERDGVDLPDEVGTLLAWVVRESTTNVLRHSTATRCRIALRAEGTEVALEVTNNGGGAPGSLPGSGLAGMTERVSALGGVLTAGPGRQGEFRLRAVLPLTPYKRS